MLTAADRDKVAFLTDVDKAVFSVYCVGSQFSFTAMFVNLNKVLTLYILKTNTSNSSFFTW